MQWSAVGRHPRGGGGGVHECRQTQSRRTREAVGLTLPTPSALAVQEVTSRPACTSYRGISCIGKRFVMQKRVAEIHKRSSEIGVPKILQTLICSLCSHLSPIMWAAPQHAICIFTAGPSINRSIGHQRCRSRWLRHWPRGGGGGGGGQAEGWERWQGPEGWTGKLKHPCKDPPAVLSCECF